MNLRSASHVAFADESNWNACAGQYCSLTVASATRSEAQVLDAELRSMLRNRGIDELKWQKLKSDELGRTAKEIVAKAVEWCSRGKLRIDTLIWDTHDSRHAIRGRDDTKNLERMFFHLLRHVLDRCWPDSSEWAIYPDERSDFEWWILSEILQRKGTQALVEYSLFKNSPSIRLRHSFKILGLEERDSRSLPLIQLADLFAGLGQYSRSKFKLYQQWLRAVDDQGLLFSSEQPKVSRADRHRFPVLRQLSGSCKVRKLGVGLRSSGGLETRDPSRPINFWFYRPQHEADRAPTRDG